MRLYASIFAFSFYHVTLKFSIHNFFEIGVFIIIKIFDIEFPNNSSHFEPFCLSVKMASETVIKPNNEGLEAEGQPLY